VDLITGLSPVIAIEQKTISRNPRSTVGTITEIYDLLRLLYARASDAFSHVTGERMVRYTDDQILHLLLTQHAGQELLILAPLVRGRKGHYRELFEQLLRQGFLGHAWTARSRTSPAAPGWTATGPTTLNWWWTA
jgi:excinuclease ABC subunit A